MSDNNTTEQKNGYALFVAKPDATRDTLDIKILDELQESGLSIIKAKYVTFTPEQATRLYDEKSQYNYFPQLVDFMSSGQSLCLILKDEVDGEAVRKAKGYRDWARLNLKQVRFDLTEEDTRMLSEGNHPMQKEITREMALENLIHVSDDFCAQTPVLGEIFNSWDLAEVRDRDPELHSVLSEAKRAVETNREIQLYRSGSPERR